MVTIYFDKNTDSVWNTTNALDINSKFLKDFFYCFKVLAEAFDSLLFLY